jgi:tetratricopeptide (TPR) repeat protein
MAEPTLRPIAFMVMPFRKRPIANQQEGLPAEVDFDALWDRAFRPALEQLGYLAVRADAETGTVIVKDMLERLAYADLVLADLTLPNGNVYYEVGIRHVARETRCVLIAAQWSKQLFDVDQFRALRYPLTNGAVPEDEAKAIAEGLRAGIANYREALTPYYELVRGVPSSSVFRSQVETISAFQARVREVRMTPDEAQRRQKVTDLVTEYRSASFELPEVAAELLTLVRDNLSWEQLVQYVEALPDGLRRHPFTKEQTLLAQSQLGDHAKAIAGLQELIALEGDTPERRGLIGGRYKRLWRAARDARRQSGAAEPDLKESGYLDDAIENYGLGMQLDLNAYYCASNLPGLLRARRGPGDAEEAAFLDRFVVLVTQRTIDLKRDDGWARATLLGAAFRLGDVAGVARLTREVAREGPAKWQLESTLADIKDTVESVVDPALKAQLAKHRDQLSSLLSKA